MAVGVSIFRPGNLEPLPVPDYFHVAAAAPHKGALVYASAVPACCPWDPDSRRYPVIFTGLAYLPIADAISIFFIEPMLVTLSVSFYLFGDEAMNAWKTAVGA